MRVQRLIPWVGVAFAVFAFASAVRRKGLVGGTIHTALDAMPVVGGVKILAERMRGRDFIRDRSLT